MMRNGHQIIDRVIPDNDPCPDCGYRARILRQTAEAPPAGLVGRVLGQVGEQGVVVENRAKVTQVWALCFHCLRRERWGWEREEWKLLETLNLREWTHMVEAEDGS